MHEKNLEEYRRQHTAEVDGTMKQHPSEDRTQNIKRS